MTWTLDAPTRNQEELRSTNMKGIIMAISEYLKSEDVPEDGISAMGDSLKQLAKGLFVAECTSVKDEDEDEDDVREDPGI